MPPTEPEDLQRVLNLCDEALEKPVNERSVFLARACQDNPKLRRAVDSLLVSVGSSDHFLSPEKPGDLSSLVGQTVGDYRIVERLGAGGMGSVFLAERDGGDFEQRVAIKMIRRYMVSQELIERFDSERRILAALNHPYIARLIDGGTTPEGVPYLVMEYIEGIQIDTYCDQNRLDVGQRIDLLRLVATAVQAAHQNLIVHRDLKPANVLITADGIPKLLDFGIAKLIDPANAAASGHTTQFGHLPLTPDYSSPEQILEGAVTTAGDIYSLGVMSYELLTGTRPYELSSTSHPQLMKSVESLTIARPSTHMQRQPDDKVSEWARHRASTPQRLAKTLSGDLDRILLKALHKDPAQRYESVGAFVRDLDRYRAGLPVEAREDTFGYRVSKFVARNKLAAGAASVTLLAVFAALGVSVWQTGIAKEQSAIAQAQLVRAEAVSDFLGDILLSPSVNWDGVLQTGPSATIADVLEAAEAQLDTELVDYPEVRVELYHKISEALEKMELDDDALRVQNKAVSLAETALPESSPLRVDAYYFMAAVLLRQGDSQGSIDYFHRAMDLANQQSDELNLRKLYILADLAMTHAERHEFELALEMQQQVIDGSYEVLGPGLKPPHTLAYANLASATISLGRFDEGRKHVETGLEAYELYPEQTQSIGGILYDRLARLEIVEQNLSQAQAHYQRAIELYDGSFGAPNTSSAESRMRLANLFIYTGNLDKADRQMQLVGEQIKSELDEPETWSYHLAQGHRLLASGAHAAALESIRTALTLGYESEMARFDRAEARWLLVRALLANGRADEARQEYEMLLQIDSAWIGDDTPYKQAILAQAF